MSNTFRDKLLEGVHFYADWSEHDTERLIEKAVRLHEEEMEALQKKYDLLVAAVNSSSDCLPGCDSYAHEDECPHTNMAVKLTALEAENQRLREKLERAEKAIRDAIEVDDARRSLPSLELLDSIPGTLNKVMRILRAALPPSPEPQEEAND